MTDRTVFSLRLLVVLLCLDTATAWAQSRTHECRRETAVRLVDVDYPAYPETVPCEVRYGKPPAEGSELIARAAFDPEYCDRKAGELLGRLTAAGYDCHVTQLRDRTAGGSSDTGLTAANYVAILQEQAELGEAWAFEELRRIQSFGREKLEEQWTDFFFDGFDVNGDGRNEWYVSSASCNGVDCDIYLFESSASPRADGYFDLRMILTADTVWLDRLSCENPEGEWAPIYTRTRHRAIDGWKIYEKAGERYSLRYACGEKRANDGSAVISWSEFDGQEHHKSTEPGTSADCRQRLMAKYADCTIPPGF